MSLIANIKDQVCILDVASRFMEFQKYGRRYKTNCPFHSERTPSFIIDPEKGRFRCHGGGCNAHGDVIDLWARLNDVDTKTAVCQLANEYGIVKGELSERAQAEQASKYIRGKRKELQRILLEAITWMKKRIKSIKVESDKDLNHYGERLRVYHEMLDYYELWLHNSELYDAAELRWFYENRMNARWSTDEG